jgi:hypothetical protein
MPRDQDATERVYHRIGLRNRDLRTMRRIRAYSRQHGCILSESCQGCLSHEPGLLTSVHELASVTPEALITYLPAPQVVQMVELLAENHPIRHYKHTILSEIVFKICQCKHASLLTSDLLQMSHHRCLYSRQYKTQLVSLLLNSSSTCQLCKQCMWTRYWQKTIQAGTANTVLSHRAC